MKGRKDDIEVICEEAGIEAEVTLEGNHLVCTVARVGEDSAGGFGFGPEAPAIDRHRHHLIKRSRKRTTDRAGGYNTHLVLARSPAEDQREAKRWIGVIPDNCGHLFPRQV
jgi:hypothetical protein